MTGFALGQNNTVLSDPPIENYQNMYPEKNQKIYTTTNEFCSYLYSHLENNFSQYPENTPQKDLNYAIPLEFKDQPLVGIKYAKVQTGRNLYYDESKPSSLPINKLDYHFGFNSYNEANKFVRKLLQCIDDKKCCNALVEMSDYESLPKDRHSYGILINPNQIKKDIFTIEITNLNSAFFGKGWDAFTRRVTISLRHPSYTNKIIQVKGNNNITFDKKILDIIQHIKGKNENAFNDYIDNSKTKERVGYKDIYRSNINIDETIQNLVIIELPGTTREKQYFKSFIQVYNDPQDLSKAENLYQIWVQKLAKALSSGFEFNKQNLNQNEKLTLFSEITKVNNFQVQLKLEKGTKNAYMLYFIIISKKME